MKNLYICFIFLLFLIGCKEEVTMNERIKMASIKDVPDATWQKLAKKKIFFGHQSVGDNIMSGFDQIISSNQAVKLNVIKTKDAKNFDGPVFAHAYIGKNGDTNSKFREFADIINNGIGDKVDIAFLKMCFWDIRRGTDVSEVLHNYKKTIRTLQKKYPNITFIHMTVPLMSHSNSFIDKVKRIIRPDNSVMDNIKRNKLNQLIVKEYSNKEPIFNIALLESTRQDGTRATFSNDKNSYYYLAQEYTDDGGHLNKLASKYVAEQLLITLAKLIEKN